MSGFRDFNVGELKPADKTLSSSLEEDDWETEPDGHLEQQQSQKPASNSNISQQKQQPLAARAPMSGPPPKPARASLTQRFPNTSTSNIPEASATPSSNSVSNSPFKNMGSNSNFLIPNLGSSNGLNKASSSTGVYKTPNAPYNRVESGSTPNAPYNRVESGSNVNKTFYGGGPSSNNINSHSSSNVNNALQNVPTTLSTNFPSSIKNLTQKLSNANLADSQNSVYKQAGGLNYQNLAQQYTCFSSSEISAIHQQFLLLDKDKDGNYDDNVHPNDLSSLATKAGESHTSVLAKLSQLRLINDKGLVSFTSFLHAVSAVKGEKSGSGANNVGIKDTTKIVLHGSAGESTRHTINVDEKESFTEHINQCLANDPLVKSRLPIDPFSMNVFGLSKDGLLLAALINNSVPLTIDVRALNTNAKMSPFQITENLNVVINSAKAIGCSVVNIGASDIIECREHLILGLIWQIIKRGLQANIDIKVHPELFRLLLEGETLEEFLKLPVEKILLRWMNYHLAKAGCPRTVTNFGADVKDGVCYTYLLNQLAPHLCSKKPLDTSDMMHRAEEILSNASKMGCRKYLTPKTMVEGNRNLNFAFVANLFNLWPGLEKLSDAEMAGLDDSLFGSGDREPRAFALWLNSLGVDPFVYDLFEGTGDGIVLLQAFDFIHKGIVDWKKVNQAKDGITLSKFKKVENCNYVVILGKSRKFSLVGIQGSDIVDGTRKLVLALTWQMMREHVIETLKSLSGNGHEITDSDLIAWANDSVTRAGKRSRMTGFKDPALATSHFFIDLLEAVRPGIVNYDLVTPATTEEGAKLNAMYVISIARKLGATIFVLPEDIVEVNPKMILTLIGSLMAASKSISR